MWTGGDQVIYGDKVVYSKRLSSLTNTTDVYVYSLASNSESKITNSAVNEVSKFQDIYENKVYYIQGSPLKLIEHNLNTNEKKTVIASMDWPDILRVWQNKVFYAIFTGNPGVEPLRTRLYVLDLQTNTIKQLGSDSNKPLSLNLDIWQNKVVWTDRGELYLYDLDLDKELRITSAQSRWVHPDYFRGAVAIFGNRVVFESGRDTLEIAVYDPPVNSNFTAQYFNKPDFTDRKLVNTTAKHILLNWGAGSPDPAIGADNFSARFTGVFDFDATAYRFIAQAEGSYKVYLDGSSTPLNPSPQGVNMTAGPHTVRVDYVSVIGNASLKFNFVKARSCFDLDADGSITIFDMTMLSNHFLETNPAYDLDGDGRVTILDLTLMSNQFLTKCE